MDSLKGTLTPMKVLNGTLNGGIAYGTFNYNELENKPSVNGTELVGNVNIPIPTKTSDLTNDSGFITDADVPTKTSDLTNDSGFITDADIPTKTSDLTNDSGFITSADIPTIPTNTSQLNNDSGFLTINTTPVRSVNSLTGDVNLFIPNATSQLNNDAGFITDADAPVKSVNGQTGDVNLFIPNATSQLNNDAGFLTNATIAQTGTIEDVEVASFSDGADNVPVSELMVDIESRQEGSGTPSPDNVRAISGFDSGVITVTDNQITNTYTVDFGRTVYGGFFDNRGNLVVTHGFVDLGTLSWSSLSRDRWNNNELIGSIKPPLSNSKVANIICSALVSQSADNVFLQNDGISVQTTGNLTIYSTNLVSKTPEEVKTALTGVQLVYELATPIEIQLTPVQVKTLLNNNNISANTGKIEKLVYFKTGCEAIAKLIEAMIQ